MVIRLKPDSRTWTDMQSWVALFRGINVGGKNTMPMAKLKHLLESNSCKNVRTYIQSGNVVFSSSVKSKASLSKRLLDAVELEFGFRPHLLLLTASDLLNAFENNPFPNATSQPKTLHFFFLAAKPTDPDTEAIAAIAASTETYLLTDSVFYLHAPDGFGRSKLAAGVERKLRVPVTARNYSTVDKLVTMIADS